MSKDKKRLVPVRRFKEFENDAAWKQQKLGEVSVVNSGRDYKHLNKGNIPVYGTGGYMLSVDKALSEKDDGIGIGRKGTINKPYILRAPFWTVDTLFYVIPTTTNLNFLYGIFQKINWQKKDESTGVPSLSKENINKTRILIPNISEQEKIGEAFCKLDKLITLHQRKLDKLKRVKSAYLTEMFPAEGEREPKRRFPGFTGAWKQRKLGDLVRYQNGVGHEGNQLDEGKYELVNLNSISIDGGLKSSGKFINTVTRTLKKNDLVMVLSDVGHGDLLGRVAIIPENNRYVLNQRVALLSTNDQTDIKFLFSYINAHQRYFKREGAGSSQLNISRGSVEKFEVLLPTIDEQKQIGRYCSNIDSLITLHQRKLDKLKKLKAAYLNEMFV
ncbi:restriction endonuclease subunit S [Lactiplantibacillus plantarum]|uniref:restriction endonuclease subunit S n=1 Tax=Lactiplantibacillus plantarum TaxID=1590 RepID=UPI000933D637|nr:restriction endonuclease subunit S [Lactiplantibacillus plantarum]AWI39921.1 restriction endonuclease subunit S [Lactiplantibacillus plantarum]MCG0833989.1 restriction endonuclease subunit S [Lactiplantibacillus plantarum]MCT0221263.1 restriction endonuclease subunit S [Lactiplantibacillus plantarum]MCW6118241.1 restriction endonuclease subunit S [Lactiplantibacillus plantarum]WKF79829.1 restriction endonuclease subunit S [Lactiplantibacillus plantarum]